MDLMCDSDKDQKPNISETATDLSYVANPENVDSRPSFPSIFTANDYNTNVKRKYEENENSSENTDDVKQQFDIANSNAISFIPRDVAVNNHQSSDSDEYQEIARPKQLFICECGKAFQKAHALKMHKRVHSGEKPHECDECSKQFRTVSNLNRHKLTSHNDVTQIGKSEPPFKCYACDKTFNWAHSLKKHMGIHSSVTKYKCDLCYREFTQKCNLNRHKIVHTGEKKYKCDECGKSFALVGNLKQHKLTHIENKPHKCDVCVNSYSRLSSLKLHMIKHYDNDGTIKEQSTESKSITGNNQRKEKSPNLGNVQSKENMSSMEDGSKTDVNGYDKSQSESPTNKSESPDEHALDVSMCENDVILETENASELCSFTDSFDVSLEPDTILSLNQHYNTTKEDRLETPVKSELLD